MTITVFTPAYNRALTIPRLYQSLVKQSVKDFEWLVIDDGSSDNTEALIAEFIAEKKIAIRYLKTKNGGKHRAINKALDMAAGEIFFIVDSDDYLVENALARILYWFRSIEKEKDSCNFAGVAGLRGSSVSMGGLILGETFRGEFMDARYHERKKRKITGDKAEAFYTNVLKNYRFPEFEGENFIKESVVWAKMGNDGYKLRYFNEVIYICEYLEGGLTDRSLELRRKNIKGTLYTYSTLMGYKCPLSLKLRYLLNYLRFLCYKYIDRLKESRRK